MTFKRPLALLILLLAATGPGAFADEPAAAGADADQAKKAADVPVPPPFKSVTQHRLHSSSGDIDYTATAEEIYLKDDQDKPTASFFTIAYTRNGVRPEERPVTFVFNGAPDRPRCSCISDWSAPN